jgi:hypothetical protein
VIGAIQIDFTDCEKREHQTAEVNVKTSSFSDYGKLVSVLFAFPSSKILSKITVLPSALQEIQFERVDDV